MKIKSVLSLILLSIQWGVLAQPSLTVPKITSLSIDPNNNAEAIVTWNSPDPAEQVLYFGLKYFPFPSPNSQYQITNPVRVDMPDTTYRATIVDFSRRVSYRMQAFQSLNSNASSHLFEAMDLQAQYNVCLNSVVLNWTSYQMYAINSSSTQIPNNPEADAYNAAITYEIWGYEAPIGSVFDMNLAHKIKGTGTQTIDVLIENLNVNVQYFAFIKALLPGGHIATSNRVDVKTTSPTLPSFMYIDTLRSSAGNIDLHIQFDKSTQLDTFAIYRTDNPYRPLKWYYEKDVPGTFHDSQGLSIGQIYGYYLVAFRCGKPILHSDTVSNILLSTDPKGLAIGLTWTAGMSGLPLQYRLYRIQPAPTNSVSFPSDVHYYLDESAGDSLCNGPKEFQYYLEAYSQRTLIRTDVEQVYLQPVVSMPNAIDPLSELPAATYDCRCNTSIPYSRRFFGPVFDLNTDAYSLTLEIYNKTGKRIFYSFKAYTDHYLNYWDGYDNGKAQEGIYFYGMKLEFKNGAPPVINRGSLKLLY